MSRRARALLLLPLLLAGCAAPPPTDAVTRARGALGDIDVEVVEHPPEAVDAPGGPAGDLVTLPDAIRSAVLHDPRLQAALAKVRSARADADQARLLPNPILSVSVRLRETESPVVTGSLAADLISLLQRPRKTSAADNRLRAAAGEVLTTLADVVTEVQDTYSSVQALGEEVSALEQRLKLSQRLIELGEARFKAGEAARFDVTALQAQGMQARVDAAEKRQELVEARLILARLIGEPSSPAGWRLSPWSPPAAPRAASPAWIAAAMRGRSELRSKEWELAALGDEEALARLALWEGGHVGVDSERDLVWSVGPSFSTPLPLFDWGQARRAKASAELTVARHQMTLLRRQVVQEVRTQFSAYDASLRTLGVARDELLPLQERRTAQAEAAYKAGETDVANLLLATQELLDTRVKVVQLQKKTALARSKLQRAVGGIGAAAAVEVAAATRPSATQPATREARP